MKILFIAILVLKTICAVADNGLFVGNGFSAKGDVNEADSMAFLALSMSIKTNVNYTYTTSKRIHNNKLNESTSLSSNIRSDVDFAGIPTTQEIISKPDGSVSVRRIFNSNKYISELYSKIDSLCSKDNINKFLWDKVKDLPNHKSFDVMVLQLSPYTSSLLLGNYYKAYNLLNNDVVKSINPNAIHMMSELKSKSRNFIIDNPYDIGISEVDGGYLNIEITENNFYGDVNCNTTPCIDLNNIYLNVSSNVLYEVYRNNTWVMLDKLNSLKHYHITHKVYINDESNRFKAIELRIPFIIYENNKFIKLNAISPDWYPTQIIKSKWYSIYGTTIYITKAVNSINENITNKSITTKNGELILNNLVKYLNKTYPNHNIVI